MFASVPMGPPQNLTMTATSSEGVRLTWDPPEKKLRNGNIILYEIVYYKEANQVQSQNVNTSDTHLDIVGLDTDTIYMFQIKAYTIRGAGPWGTRKSFKTFEDRKYSSHVYCV